MVWYHYGVHGVVHRCGMFMVWMACHGMDGIVWMVWYGIVWCGTMV